MKFSTLILSVTLSLFALLSSQGVTQACLVSGAHHQEKVEDQQKMDKDHECCKKSASTSSDKNSKSCNGAQCFEIISFDIPVSFLKSEESKSKLSFLSLEILSPKKITALTSLVLTNFTKSMQNGSHFSVPLYIAFNRLFIPNINS